MKFELAIIRFQHLCSLTCSIHTYKRPLKLRSGPPYSRKDPGMRLIFSDSTRRAEHAHIGETSQRMAKSGVRTL